MVAHTVGQLAEAGIAPEDIGYEQFHEVGADDAADDVLSGAGGHQ
jgi:hypothetical protein